MSRFYSYSYFYSYPFLLSLLPWCSLLLLSADLASAVERIKFDVKGSRSNYVVYASMNTTVPKQAYEDALWRGIKIAADNFPADKNRPFNVSVKFKSLASKGGAALISRSRIKWLKIPEDNPRGIFIQAATYKSLYPLPSDFAGYDIEIHLDNNTDWHTKAAKSVPPTQYDLSTVALNELYRSFIFSGFLKLNDAETKAYSKNKRISRYDSLLVKSGCPFLETPSDSWLEAVTLKNSLGLFLNDASQYYPSVYTPASFVQGSSIYSRDCATDFRPWELGCEKLPRGVRSLKLSDELKNIQATYLNLAISPAMGVQKCLDANKQIDAPPIEEVKPKKKKLIGGMPIWVFGLCLVILCIVLAILVFALCTIGAVQKQKERQSCWKRFTWCCTAINPEPELPVGISSGDHLPQGRLGGSSSALFTYIDTTTAQRYSLEGNPLGDSNRASLSGLRNSFDVVRYALGIPNTSANHANDDNVSHGIAAAETVLPGRLDNL